MKIVILSHPLFFGSYSMPRFANYLFQGMAGLGYDVQVWRPQPYLYKLPVRGMLKKWLGYVDQYVIFSIILFFKTHFTSQKKLYVLSDQALGFWVPIITGKAHMVHCHDFLALKSAKGEISVNPVGFTGRLYQKLIFKGFSQANNFISVSKNTKCELEAILNKRPKISEYVYNGLNPIFLDGDKTIARKKLGARIDRSLENGYLLHVGGNQFYKNRIGVIKIYDAFRNRAETNIPLVMIGSPPDRSVLVHYQASKYKADILFCSGLNDEMVKFAYQGASLFLFPSLAEGFGWPIAEAMACGCPVITTDQAPMNEVGADAAIYVSNTEAFNTLEKWAQEASEKVADVVGLNTKDLNELRYKGLENVKRFDSHRTIPELNALYTKAYNQKYG